MSVYSSGCVNSSINSNLTVLSGTNSLFISFGYTGIMRCLIGRFPALLLQLTNQLLSRNLSVPVILVNLIPPSFNVVVHDTEYQLLTSCLILMCNLHGNHLPCAISMAIICLSFSEKSRLYRLTSPLATRLYCLGYFAKNSSNFSDF